MHALAVNYCRALIVHRETHRACFAAAYSALHVLQLTGPKWSRILLAGVYKANRQDKALSFPHVVAEVTQERPLLSRVPGFTRWLCRGLRRWAAAAAANPRGETHGTAMCAARP